MDEVNIRVAISGVSGRMGRQLVSSLLVDNFNYKSVVSLTGGIVRRGSKFVGCDIGALIGSKSVGVLINDSLEAICDDFDILIDFSSNEGTLEYLNFCNIYNKNMVVGTTGFTQNEILFFRDISRNIGIVFSSNFSVMINLMLKLLKKASCILKNCLDIEITETHHRNKRDVPSGTALMIQKSIKSGLLLTSNQDIEVEIKNDLCNRNIKIHSVRAGDIVGEHSVVFFNTGECLEISHRAFSREIFANGAILSAVWLGKKRVGLFDMNDVMNLDTF